jgi:hypothetical protein
MWQLSDPDHPWQCQRVEHSARGANTIGRAPICGKGRRQRRDCYRSRLAHSPRHGRWRPLGSPKSSTVGISVQLSLVTPPSGASKVAASTAMQQPRRSADEHAPDMQERAHRNSYHIAVIVYIQSDWGQHLSPEQCSMECTTDHVLRRHSMNMRQAYKGELIATVATLQ